MTREPSKPDAAAHRRGGSPSMRAQAPSGQLWPLGATSAVRGARRTTLSAEVAGAVPGREAAPRTSSDMNSNTSRARERRG